MWFFKKKLLITWSMIWSFFYLVSFLSFSNQYTKWERNSNQKKKVQMWIKIWFIFCTTVLGWWWRERVSCRGKKQQRSRTGSAAAGGEQEGWRGAGRWRRWGRQSAEQKKASERPRGPQEDAARHRRQRSPYSHRGGHSRCVPTTLVDGMTPTIAAASSTSSESLCKSLFLSFGWWGILRRGVQCSCCRVCVILVGFC